MHVAWDARCRASLRFAAGAVAVVDGAADRQRALPVARHLGLDDQLWVEPVGELIVARLRGVPTVELLQACQQRVLALAKDAGRSRVMYDSLEMLPPPIDVPWFQRSLDENPEAAHLRRAIVVPNTKLAFLARLAFGEGNYRVFYNDIAMAVRWLEEPSSFELKIVR